MRLDAYDDAAGLPARGVWREGLEVGRAQGLELVHAYERGEAEPSPSALETLSTRLR